MAKCSHDPRTLAVAPIGMYHCPECGEMVVAGYSHGESKPTLPDCMMPDGAEPCAAYSTLRSEVAELRSKISRRPEEMAFPYAFTAGEHQHESAGMSLWDYFAAHAPLPNAEALDCLRDNSVLQSHVMWACDYADALMAERARRLSSASGDPK